MASTGTVPIPYRDHSLPVGSHHPFLFPCLETGAILHRVFFRCLRHEGPPDQKKIPEPVVSFLFLLGAALALIGIFSTIILLPGVTVNNVLSVSEFKELGHFFIAIGVVLVSLYFIVRYIHGITSRDLLTRFTKGKTECLFHQIEITGDTGQSPAAAEHADETGLSALCRAAELLLEAQIYQVDKKTLFGTFPVYIVNPDFSWVFSPAVPHEEETPLG